MIATINSNLLSQVKIINKQYDIRDTKLKGFLLRVNPSGKINYVCEYKRCRRINLGSISILTPMQARDRAKEILGDAVKGIDPHAAKKQKDLSLRLFIENEYRPWVETHRKSGRDIIARIKRCFYSLFADRPLTDISSIAVDHWRTQKVKTGCNAETVNRDVATFKAALSKTIEWGFIEKHPLEKFKLFKTDTSPKVRYLNNYEEYNLRQALIAREIKLKQTRDTANEWRKARNYPLLPSLDQSYVDYLQPMILLSLNTGMRRGELFSLQWNNIDFTRRFLTITASSAKGKKTLHIPLNDEAFTVLQKWHKQTSEIGLVFSNKGKKFDNVDKAWHTLLKTAQIENFRWHDMRHHFASRLVMAGVDLNTVRELLGHSDIKMTLRYAHFGPEHKAQAVAKLINSAIKINDEITL